MTRTTPLLALLVLVSVLGGRADAARGGAGGGSTGLSRSSDLRARHGKHTPHNERQLDAILESILPVSSDIVESLVAAVAPAETTSSVSSASTAATSSSTTEEVISTSAAPATSSTSSEAPSTSTTESVASPTTSSADAASTTVSLAAEISSTSTTISSADPATTSSSSPTTSDSVSEAVTTSSAESTSTAAASTAEETSLAPTTSAADTSASVAASTPSEAATSVEIASAAPTTSDAPTSTSDAPLLAVTESVSVAASVSILAQVTDSTISDSVAASETSTFSTASPAETTASQTTLITASDTFASATATATDPAVTPETSATDSTRQIAESTTDSAVVVPATTTLDSPVATASDSVSIGSEASATQDTASVAPTETPSPTPTETAVASETTSEPLAAVTSLVTLSQGDATSIVTSVLATDSIVNAPIATETSAASVSQSAAQGTSTTDVATPSPSPSPSGAVSDSAVGSATDSGFVSATGADSAVVSATGADSVVVSATGTDSVVVSATPTDSAVVSATEGVFSGSESATASAASSGPVATDVPFPSDSVTDSAYNSSSSSTSYYEPPAPSASASPSSVTSDTDDVWYPTQSALILPIAATTTESEASTSTAIETETGSSYIPVPTVAAIPLNLPSVILPAANTEDGSATAQADAHADDTLVSLLFSDALAWTFVANNSEATAQVMLYTPILVETALALNTSGASTYALKAYQPASINGVVSPVLTTWVGYVPTSLVADLQAQIKASNSAFYNQSGIPGEIALQVNKAFPIVNSFAATSGSSADTSSSGSGSSLSSRNRDIIIGVTVSIGGSLWILLVVWIYRKMRRNAKADIHRRMSMNPTLSGRGLANVNMMSQTGTDSVRGGTHARSSSVDIDGRPSSFYAFSPPSINDRASSRPQSRDLGSLSSTNGQGAGAIGSGRFSTIYRALGGGGQGGRPISPESPSTGVFGQTASAAPSMTRRRAAPNAPISAPRNFRHILSDPVNPFSNPIADSYQHQQHPYPQSKARVSPYPTGPSGDPFADSNAVHNKIQRKPFQAADISGPVLRESSLGF